MPIPVLLKRRVLTSLLPQDCVLCGRPETAPAQTAGGSLLCEGCRGELPYLTQSACPVCALPTAGATVCGHCLATPPRYDGTRAALAYRYPFEPLLRHYKYHGAVALGALFSDLLHEALPTAGADAAPDFVTVIPLARARLAERGFNQAMEIARPLAKRRGLRLVPGLAHRVRHTPPQADLPFDRRRGNVRGAFACIEDLSGMTVAVVDDVMTTGATLDEFARVLKRRGAASVVNWVVARTLPRN